MSRRMAECRYRDSIQSFPGWHAASDTAVAHEPGLFVDSGKTLARSETRDTTVVDMYQKT